VTTKKWLLISVIIVLVILYFIYSPQDKAFFPKCPVLYYTGLQCPGCGSQRAIHFLLHADIISALKANFLLVISIPYLILGFVFEQIKQPNKKILKWRKILYGYRAIIIVLIVIILFCILRNIFLYC
jgi:hypothetical protein